MWTPERPRCCGALQLHTGVDARERAKETIAVFEGCDTIVVNAAGCGSAMKDYGHVLRNDPQWASGRRRSAPRSATSPSCWPSTSRRRQRHPLPMTVAYHDACHLAHAQGVRAQPRELLHSIPELELREPAEWELCCGSAGVWNLLNPEPAAELGRRKARNLLDTGAEAVVAANPGCALQIGAFADVPVHHPVQLLAASMKDGCHDRRRDRPRTGRRRPHRRRAELRRRAARALRGAPARAAGRARQAPRGDRRGGDARLPGRDARDPRGRLAGRAGAGRPAGPPRGDHRARRPQDDHQRAQLGRARASWPTSRTRCRRRGRTSCRARRT